MRRSALAALLAICASCAASKTTTVSQSKHWTPTERAQVLVACAQRFGTGRFCDCMTERLEALSPDPDTELTSDDVKQGIAACKDALDPGRLSEL